MDRTGHEHPDPGPDAASATDRPTTRTPTTARRPARTGSGAGTSTQLLADLVAVVVFVVLGRRAHAEGGLVTGTAQVAWPFLVATAAGWVVLVAARRPAPRSIRGGLVVLATTVAVGMTLRRLTGGGVEPSFVAVATTVLGTFLIGGRLVARRRGGG